MTFAELKQQTAKDLRDVIALIEQRAKAVDEGDLDAMDKLLSEEWRKWHEMLWLRYAHRHEQREASSQEPRAATETSGGQS